MTNIELNCPSCLSGLDASASALLCTGCRTSFPVTDGIADLRMGRKDYYFNPVARPQMKEIIDEAAGDGWPRAIRRFMVEVKYNPDWIDNLVVDGRYAWKLFLGLAPDARVLDLGCGLGNLTKNVAPNVGEVCALDLTWERLQFAQRRFGNFNRGDRISLVAGGDGKHLPFADATFDAVLISGVLEWVADDSSLWADAPGKLQKLWRMFRAHFGATNPRKVQLAFLREIRRVLKPSGQAFIGIENRLNHEYYSGRPDHHSGLLYGSLMPRPLATIYSIARSRVPYRTYTYSDTGYRRLLGEAGFDRCDFLGLTPGYSHLSEIIPYDGDASRWSLRPPVDAAESRQRSKRHIPAYGIVASAGATARGSASLIERIAAEAQGNLGSGGSRLQLSELTVTEEAVAVAMGSIDGRGIALRIPLNESAAAAESANHQALTWMAANRATLCNHVPVSLAHGNVQNMAYFVESALPGKSLAARDGTNDEPVLLEQMSRLLAAMNPESSLSAVERLDEAAMRHDIDSLLAAISPAVEDDSLIAPVRNLLLAQLSGTQARRGLVHGDLVPGNVRVADGRIAGLLNWGNWACVGWPILDAIRFVRGLAENVGGRQSASVLQPAALEDLPDGRRGFLLEQYRLLGSDPARHMGFACLSWLHEVRARIHQLALDPKDLDVRVKQVLRAIAASS